MTPVVYVIVAACMIVHALPSFLFGMGLVPDYPAVRGAFDRYGSDGVALLGVWQAVLFNSGALWPDVFQTSDFWRLLSYGFLHGNLVHLGMNMAGLLLLGSELERMLGWRRFLLLYVLSMVAGGLGFVFWQTFMNAGVSISCVGASGAISGVLGAVVALFPRRDLVFVFLPMVPFRAWVFAVNLALVHVFFMLTPYGGNVAYDVHLAGGLSGFLLAKIWAMRQRSFFQKNTGLHSAEQAWAELAELVQHPETPGADERVRALLDGLRYEDRWA